MLKQYHYYYLKAKIRGVMIQYSHFLYENQQNKGRKQLNQSFRLHHVNKTTSLRKTSQSFLDLDESFKLAALNSVNRGVKLVDISMLTGDNLNKLRVEPLQPKQGQYLSAHCNLKDVRERYDEMKKATLLAEQHIGQQKEQLNKLLIFKKVYDDKISQGKTKVTTLQQNLVDKKQLLGQTITQLKVLLSLQARHNSDKVVYDQRKYDSDQRLKHLRKQLAIYKNQGHTMGQGTDRTTKIYEKLREQLTQEQNEREMHIDNIQTMIRQKQALIQVNQYRASQLADIASRAIQDKAQDQKHWRMVYLTHVFVNRMLRYKIETEMQKFKIVEQAFKTIKTATGVSDARTLINKYLNKENVYGQLLGKIADNQKIISSLKSQAEELINSCKAQQAQKQVLHSVKIKSQDLHQHIKQFETQQNKSVTAYSLTQKLMQWVNRQLKKVSALNGNTEKQPQSFEQAMQQLANTLSKEVELIQDQNLQKQEGQPGHPERNVRIVPKRSRINSMGQEIFDVDEEQTNPSSNSQQLQFVNGQRDEILRENQRYMRQVRRKFQEERKLLAQKQESKAKSPVKVAEPKKED